MSDLSCDLPFFGSAHLWRQLACDETCASAVGGAALFRVEPTQKPWQPQDRQEQVLTFDGSSRACLVTFSVLGRPSKHLERLTYGLCVRAPNAHVFQTCRAR